MQTIKLIASLVSARRLSDKTVSMSFKTQQLSSEEFMIVDTLLTKKGWLLFSLNEDEVAETEIPKERPVEVDQKTPSQRLRGVLYRQWELLASRPGMYISFEDYYRSHMERLINQEKQRIDAK